MSFSRAKLQRFNDTNPCTPSPADYNVPNQARVTGALIPKSERFVHQSPASSENGSCASNPSAVFRTPNPPRKLKVKASSASKIKPSELFQNLSAEEHVKEKIVECNNKDETIKELLEQLEEYKQSVSTIRNELEYYRSNNVELQNNVQQLEEDKGNALKGLSDKYNNDVETIRNKTVNLSGVMAALKGHYEEVKRQNQVELKHFVQQLQMLQSVNQQLMEVYEEKLEGNKVDLEIKEQQLEQLEGEYLQLKRSFDSERENLKLDFDLQLDALECKLQSQISTLENELEEARDNHNANLAEVQNASRLQIDDLRREFEKEQKQLCDDNDAKIKQLTENYKEGSLLVEIQMKEKCKDIEEGWKLKLEDAKREADAILKECQDIAEYNVIQCELEKNQAVAELSELKQQLEYLKISNETINTDFKKLKNKNGVLHKELDETVKKLQQTEAQCLEYVNAIARASKDKHLYELTITKTHNTVDALKRRLMKSDQDVEQLKAELEATESSKLQFEGKCNQLMDELDVLFSLCDDKDEQNNLAIQVFEQKVSQLEEKLHNEVDKYKEEAVKEVQVLQNELELTRTKLKDSMDELHNQQELIISASTLISTANSELDLLEENNLTSTKKIVNLTNTLVELKEKLAINIEVQKTLTWQNENLKKLLQEKEQELIAQVEERDESYKTLVEKNCKLESDHVDVVEKYNSLLKRYDAKCNENVELEKKLNEQESLIGPFRQHLEAYKAENSQLAILKKDAEQEAREMGLKYAQLLGHQNQKQKIKHLMDLKLKNYDLMENKKELENKIRLQSKTIENLRKELSMPKSPKTKKQQFGDKENIGSPNVSLNSSRVDSPGGPLRERN